METHTPAPWHVEDHLLDDDPRLTIESRERSIAKIQLPDERDTANALLIAAAPDLLAALMNIVKNGFSREAEAQAVAAIARAEGR